MTLTLERHMKRKGPRSVPDFSRKPKGKPDSAQADTNAPPPKQVDRVVKPTTKSGGAGRRGG